MKQVLFIRIRKMYSFFNEYWMLGLVFVFFSGLFCFPPNYMNFNRVKGTIVKQYEKIDYIKNPGKRGGKFDLLMLQLNDSTSYGTSGEKEKKIIQKNELIGKEVEIIFTRVNDTNVIHQLKVNNYVIISDNKYLVAFFTLNLLWFLIGGITEGIKFFKKASLPIAKTTQIIQPVKPIKKAEMEFFRYTNCPACGYKLKETDKECPDCGLNLS